MSRWDGVCLETNYSRFGRAVKRGSRRSTILRERNSSHLRLTASLYGLSSVGINTWSWGSTQEYGYDEADRLIGSDIVYDSLGRITDLLQ